jgi:peptide methionine sulfoxide reductase MsrB
MFDSRAKLNSGTGLPSFREAIAGENVREKKDFNARVLRTEVMCTLCDAHLGHVFTNGLEPTGLRQRCSLSPEKTSLRKIPWERMPIRSTMRVRSALPHVPANRPESEVV